MVALRRFAAGLRANPEAASAGFTAIRSNGPPEGVVHTLTRLKRQGDGRASIDLVRRRMLCAA